MALACLVVAGVGAAVMATADRPKLAAPVTRADEASLAPFAAVVPRLPIVADAQTTADKPSCVGDTRTEGNCVSVKLRKPRMVWVANDRPAIAAVANKKAQNSARGQNHRRDQPRYGASSWREVRVDDWAVRGYVPRERDYRRGAYGRGGFTPN